LAAELRELGHSVTVLAPSTRAADLLAGRRALLDGGGADVIALGPAVSVPRRSRIGVPVGVRANLALALARGGYDVVHGFSPGPPAPACRLRVAAGRARAGPVGDPGAARPPRLGARPAADKAALGPADDPPRAAGARARPHAAGRRRTGLAPERRHGLRAGLR